MSRIPRIYVSTPLSTGMEVPLDERAAGHVLRVLRMSAGAELVLFNGRGGEYGARLSRADRQAAVAEIVSHRPVERESPLQVTLGQGISRGERMDYVIQKAVELGVAGIQPLFTERCMVQLKGARLARRVEHWRGIAIGACEQCGRNTVPSVREPMSLPDWLASAETSGGLLLDPEASVGLSVLPRAEAVRLLVGPEGGLSAAERTSALRAGFLGVRLGSRVLRTETAPVAALAAVQTLWGDLGT